MDALPILFSKIKLIFELLFFLSFFMKLINLFISVNLKTY